MAFIYNKFIAHRYSALKTNGRLRYGVSRREWMELNLYNKNWIGRSIATQKREYIKVLLMMIYVYRAEKYDAHI